MLVLAGDEDGGCLEPGLMLKLTIPMSGIVLLPAYEHTANLEDRDAVDRFLAAVKRGAGASATPWSLSTSTTGKR